MTSEKYSAIVISAILVILGIITMAFPLLSTLTIGILSAFLLLFIAVMYFTTAIGHAVLSKWAAAVDIILGVLSILLSALILVNPFDVTILISFIIYIVGFMLIISGINNIISSKGLKIRKYMGVSDILFGIIYIILGVFVENPLFLGIIIGVWLIITGIFYGIDKYPDGS